MPNPHCHIATVRPKGGGAHIKVLRPRPSTDVSLVDKAHEITQAMPEPIQGYVIFAWSPNYTHSGYLIPRGGRFHPNQIPTIMEEQLRSDIIGWTDTMNLLKELGLVRPDPPKGA